MPPLIRPSVFDAVAGRRSGRNRVETHRDEALKKGSPVALSAATPRIGAYDVGYDLPQQHPVFGKAASWFLRAVTLRQRSSLLGR